MSKITRSFYDGYQDRAESPVSMICWVPIYQELKEKNIDALIFNNEFILIFNLILKGSQNGLHIGLMISSFRLQFSYLTSRWNLAKSKTLLFCVCSFNTSHTYSIDIMVYWSFSSPFNKWSLTVFYKISSDATIKCENFL